MAPEVARAFAQRRDVEVHYVQAIEKVVAEFASGADGKFRVVLAPGTYLIDPEVGSVYPRANTQEVVVTKNVFTHITIQYDSGIR